MEICVGNDKTIQYMSKIELRAGYNNVKFRTKEGLATSLKKYLTSRLKKYGHTRDKELDVIFI